MGSSSSAAKSSDNNSTGVSTTGQQRARNPRSRGPRSFEDLGRSSSSGQGQPAAAKQSSKGHIKNPPGYRQAQAMPGSTSVNKQEGAGGSKAPSGGSTSKTKGKAIKKRHQNEPEYQDNCTVFETFYHSNGTGISCMYQSGERFYQHPKTKDWEIFPTRWYDEGFLVTERVVDQNENESVLQKLVYGIHNVQEDSQAFQNRSRDDRLGEIQHPVRGKISTYMQEERSHNVHTFFDEKSGLWVKLPLHWELHSDVVKDMLNRLQSEIPEWKDEYDMLASLRAHNYNVSQCVTEYWLLKDRNSLAKPQAGEGNKAGMKAAQDEVTSLTAQVKSLEKKMATAERDLKALQESKMKTKEHSLHLEATVAELTATNGKYKRKIVSMTNELAHYKGSSIIRMNKEELEEEREERKKADLKARELNSRMCSLSDENAITKEEMDALKKEAAEATRYAQALEAEAKKNAEVAEQLQAAQKPALDVKLAQACISSAREVSKTYYQLKVEVQHGFGEMAELISKAKKVASSLPTDPPKEMVSKADMDDILLLYRKECLQRKLLYNQLQELRGNIRVFARCRRDDRVSVALDFPSDECISVKDPKAGKRTFKFDKVYSPTSTQEEVFTDTCAIITSCVDGYNVSILAYGQTGSGKTYTMMGPADNPGVNVRAISELLKVTKDRENIDYTLSASMVEIYNEMVHDLLTETMAQVTVQQVGAKVNIQGLTSAQVNTIADVKSVIDKGMKNRTVGATKMNSESSRSHLLLMLTVEGRDRSSGSKTSGTLTLVDLAGSERAGKTEAEGQRLVEAAAINKSLSALGQVFTALGQSALHVPYRNSKLTQILQPSLSGDAKAALFVAVSPAESNLSETISTLTFGSNARQVELGQAKKNVTKGKK